MTAARRGTNPEHLPGEPTTTPDGMPKGESNKFVYDTSPETGKPLTTHQWYDGTPHPWEFKRVWHLEPSLDDPDTVYAGVEDAALFRSTDGGQTWQRTRRTARPRLRASRQPGAGGMCLHTIILDPSNRDRIFVAISGGGRISHRRRRQDLEADQQGTAFALHSRSDCRGRPLRSPHRDAPFASERAVHAEALGRHAQRRRRRLVARDQRQPCRPTSALLIDVHAHEPETIYVVPIKSDSEHYPPDGKLRVYRSRTGGNEWEALTKGLPQRDCYVNVLRDAMAVDSLDSCGVYFGTTGGQVYASADAATVGRRSFEIFRPYFQWRSRHCHDPRTLPPHLRNLAQVDGEVKLEVDGHGHAALGARRARDPLSDVARDDS